MSSSNSSGSKRDFVSSNEEGQSELTNRSGRTLPDSSRSAGAERLSATVSPSDREEPREVVVDGGRGAVAEGSASTRNKGNGTSHRGFAAMNQEKQREIASKGGRAAHVKGTAHQWSSDEARAAGRKGGEAVSQNREHMSAIGRRGGEARGRTNSGGGEKFE